MNQYTPNLGNEPAADARRDCVHVAVAPVTTAERLAPGERVGLLDGNRIAGGAIQHIGVVDPFLLRPVEAGQRCWLFLFPGTVTSIRHVWTHPAFTVKVPEAKEHQPFRGEI
jgi:hypothetical protein